MKDKSTEVDSLLYALGGLSRYQIFQYFFALGATFTAGFQLFNFVFTGRKIPYSCSKPDNISDLFNLINGDTFTLNTSYISYGKCDITVVNNVSGHAVEEVVPCVFGYQFAERKDLSITSDMDIICERGALKDLGQTLLILGQGIGAFVIPIFSDKFGRKPVMLLSHASMLIIAVGIAFVPTFTVFLVLRMMLGTVQQGVVMTKSTFGIEIFPARYRRTTVLLTSLLWSCCAMLMSLMGYLMQNLSWRYAQLVYTTSTLYVFVQFFFLDETLRWLMANGKDKEIIRNLTKAARMNGKDVEEILTVYREIRDSNTTIVKSGATEMTDVPLVTNSETKRNVSKHERNLKPSFLDLLKRVYLAKNILILWVMWVLDSMTFFGLFMTSHSLAGNRYLNVFLYALVEAPAAFVNFYLVDGFGRKKASILFHAIAGGSLLAATLVRQLGGHSGGAGIAVQVFSCVGMFGITGAWGISFFFTPEMFPTNLRNFGLGTASSISRIGGMLAPFANLLVEHVPWAPGTIFSICCLVVTVLVYFLPETAGRELPQTLDDLRGWYGKTPKYGAGAKEKDELIDLLETHKETSRRNTKTS